METSIVRMISILYRKSLSFLSVSLEKYNLTVAEHPIFAILQHHDGATQEELTARLVIDKSATARTVESLSKKGYVKCVRDKHDKRKKRVFLTATARAIWPSVKRELLRHNELLTKNIDAQSLEIAYNALLQMETNAVNFARDKGAAAALKEESHDSKRGKNEQSDLR